MNAEKLKRLQAQVRIGGKGTPRRKKKVMHQTATTDDKKLQSSLKKLSVSTIPGIEEVNIIKDDLTVIHFNNPKAQASLSANTFAVTGHGETKKIVEMLPEILPQLGQETILQLRMFANSMSNNQKQDNSIIGGTGTSTMNILDSVIEEDDVPMLVSDFDKVAKVEAAAGSLKPLNQSTIITVDSKLSADQATQKQEVLQPVQPTEQNNKIETAGNILNEVKIVQIQNENNLNTPTSKATKVEPKQQNNKPVNDAKENKKQNNKKGKQDAKSAQAKDNKQEKDMKSTDKNVNEKQAKTGNKSQEQVPPKQSKSNQHVETQAITATENLLVNKEIKEKSQVAKSAEPPKPNASKKLNENKQANAKQAKQVGTEKKPEGSKKEITLPKETDTEAAKPVETLLELKENVSEIQTKQSIKGNEPVETLLELKENVSEIQTKESIKGNEPTVQSVEQKIEAIIVQQSDQKVSIEPKVDGSQEIPVHLPKVLEKTDVKIEEKKKAEVPPNKESNKGESLAVKKDEGKVVESKEPATPESKVSSPQQSEIQTLVTQQTTLPSHSPVEVTNDQIKNQASSTVDEKQLQQPIEVPAQQQILAPMPSVTGDQQLKIEASNVQTITEEQQRKIETSDVQTIITTKNSELIDSNVPKSEAVAKELSDITKIVVESAQNAQTGQQIKQQEKTNTNKNQSESKLDTQNSLVPAKKPFVTPIVCEKLENQMKEAEPTTDKKVQQPIQPGAGQLQAAKPVQIAETKSGPVTPTTDSPKQKASPPAKQTTNNKKAQEPKPQPKSAAGGSEAALKPTVQADAKKSEAAKQKQTTQGKPQQQQPTNRSAPTTPTKNTEKPALTSKPATPTQPNAPASESAKKGNAQQKQQTTDAAAKAKQQGGGGGGKTRPAAGGNAAKGNAAATKPTTAGKKQEKVTAQPQAASNPPAPVPIPQPSSESAETAEK